MGRVCVENFRSVVVTQRAMVTALFLTFLFVIARDRINDYRVGGSTWSGGAAERNPEKEGGKEADKRTAKKKGLQQQRHKFPLERPLLSSASDYPSKSL